MKLYNFIMRVLLAIILDASILLVGLYIYVYEISNYGIELKVRKMYHKIATQTGQSQDWVPLVIVDSPMDNAGTDGTRVILYTGFIQKHKWDEIAFVMGHELAHVNLGHLNKHSPVPENNSISNMGLNGYSAVMEANADKMGAVYMMKAGYDICKGREIFTTWKNENGNSIGQTHPDYSYRYDELNINCGR